MIVSRRGERATADDRGTVTAELAVALPAVLVVLAVCLGGVQVVTRQAALVGAASAAARSVARGDSSNATAETVRQIDPAARYSAATAGDLVCVRMHSHARLLPGWAGVPLSARSCALDSSASAGTGDGR